MKKVVRIILAVLIISLMCAIFSLSAQKAQQSDGTSSSVIETIVKIMHKDFDSWSDEKKTEVVESYQHAVRKLAHMTEYAVLGVLTSCFALTFDFKIRNIIFAFLFSAGYAASDEIHQLFVEGRSGQITDVMIDSSGALIGILFVMFIFFVVSSVKRKPNKKRAD